MVYDYDYDKNDCSSGNTCGTGHSRALQTHEIISSRILIIFFSWLARVRSLSALLEIAFQHILQIDNICN